MKNDYLKELREMAGYDEDGNEIDDIQGSSDDGKPIEEEKPFDITDSLEFVVHIKEKDLRDFQFYHTYAYFRGWYGVFLSIAAIVMLIIGIDRYDIMQKVILIVLAVLSSVIQPVKILINARIQIKQQGLFQSEFKYNLCGEGILVRQGEQSFNMHWDGIRKAVKTKHALYLYISAVNAFIIPLEQIADSGHFLEAVRKNVNVRRGL